MVGEGDAADQRAAEVVTADQDGIGIRGRIAELRRSCAPIFMPRPLRFETRVFV